jgi:hypothetical protein
MEHTLSVVTNTMRGLTLEPEKTLDVKEWQLKLECFGLHTPTPIRPSLSNHARPMPRQVTPSVPTRPVASEL